MQGTFFHGSPMKICVPGLFTDNMRKVHSLPVRKKKECPDTLNCSPYDIQRGIAIPLARSH